MRIYYTIISFVFGAILGSFYNVVGYRLPRNQSLIKPSSHCTKCNHKLGASELVPIFSYLFQKGKCKNCGEKISPFYAIFETITGTLFALSYYLYGSSMEFFIAVTFISMLLIVIISDYQTMIIPDEVLIVFSLILIVELIIQNGIFNILNPIINGIISFLIMLLIKKIGDIMFKKESMGGGDIKLMGVIGLVLGWPMAVISIFLASFIGLPISLILLYKNKTDIIPFGPFLSIASIIILISGLNMDMIINLLTI